MADKMTKRDWYTEIRNIVEAADFELKDGALDFIDNQVKLLDAKAAKAKENADKKKEQGDAMREAVFAVLTDNLQTIDQITEQVVMEDVEVTKSRVTARLSQLVKADLARKDTVKTDDGRRVAAYCIN